MPHPPPNLCKNHHDTLQECFQRTQRVPKFSQQSWQEGKSQFPVLASSSGTGSAVLGLVISEQNSKTHRLEALNISTSSSVPKPMVVPNERFKNPSCNQSNNPVDDPVAQAV
jgi:hypothetical protein